jgi:hypothetical protein
MRVQGPFVTHNSLTIYQRDSLVSLPSTESANRRVDFVGSLICRDHYLEAAVHWLRLRLLTASYWCRLFRVQAPLCEFPDGTIHRIAES